jgi:hypothetical protein
MKSLDDLKKDAGDSLTKLLLCLVSEDHAVEWFYRPNSMYGKSPYELVKEGNQRRIIRDLTGFVCGDYPR